MSSQDPFEVGPLDTIDVFRDMLETARLLQVTATGAPLFNDAAAVGQAGKLESRLTSILIT